MTTKETFTRFSNFRFAIRKKLLHIALLNCAKKKIITHEALEIAAGYLYSKTATPRAGTGSAATNCCRSCMVRLLIIFILKCIIGAIVYSKYSNKQSTTYTIPSFPSHTTSYNDPKPYDPDDPIFKSIMPPSRFNITSSSNPYGNYPFHSTIDDAFGNDEDQKAVKNIKKSRLWDGRMCHATECVKAVRKFEEYVDRSVDPCDDFYGHVCGKFDKMAAKNESITSTLQQLRQNVQQQLKSIMMEPLKSQDANSVVLLKKFFSSCMNDTATRMQIDRNIFDLIRKLGGWPMLESSWDSSSFDWMNVTTNARKLGLRYDWFVDFTTDDEGNEVLPKISYPVPDLDIYFQISDDDFRDEYLSLMVDLAVFYGASVTEAKLEMTRVMEFEEKLYDKAVANIQYVALLKKLWSDSKADGDLSSYGTTTIGKMSSGINRPWLKFVQEMVTSEHRIKASSDIVYRGHDYFDYLDGLFDSNVQNRTAQNYFIWKTLYSLAAFLPAQLRTRLKVFKLKTVSLFSETDTDRSDTCFQSTNLNLFKAVEAEYVRRFVKADTKAEIKYLVSMAKRVLIRMINEENKWIDLLTKMRLTAKTREITQVIGGLDVMFKKQRYDKQLGLDTFKFSSSNVIDMFRELQLKNHEEMFSKLYYKFELSNYVEKFLTGWTSINAKYHMASNTMILSAATLQDDMYTRGRPNYLNLGAIGSFMSHELAHGTDTSVGFYISQGKLIPWLTVKAKLLNYVQTTCIDHEYQTFSETHPDLELDVNGTLSENIADFVGVDMAYRIYQRVIQQQGKDPYLPGMSQSPFQLFWMQLASMWCSAKDSKSDLARQLGVDGHAFPQFRVNGPLRNSRYFARDFACPEGSYMNPHQKCHIL